MLRLVAGIGEALPELITYRILEPAMGLPQPVQIICRRGSPEKLVADLAVQELDVVLADAPINPTVRVRVFHHLLGECGVSLCATASLAATCKQGFPHSLDEPPRFYCRPMIRRCAVRWTNGSPSKGFGPASRECLTTVLC